MDRVMFARRISGWLSLAFLAVWMSGPAVLLVLPHRTRCVAGAISCEALAGAVQVAFAVLAVAWLAVVLLRLCRRRLLDAGLSGAWVLLGTIPSLLICREITSGALTADTLRNFVEAWPTAALTTPLNLFAALAVTGIIGLIPGAERSGAATA